jgi:hypothetical protein
MLLFVICVVPMESDGFCGTDGGTEVITQIELWDRASKVYGAFIPQTTFRRWVTDVCLLPLKREYNDQESQWLLEWCKIASQYPKGSPIAVRYFRSLLTENSTNATTN